MKGYRVLTIRNGHEIITNDGVPVDGEVIDIKFWKKEYVVGGRARYELTGKVTAHINVQGVGEFHDIPVRILRAA